MSDDHDETRQFSPFDDETQPDGTRPDEVVTPQPAEPSKGPHRQPNRPDSTSVMPPVDDDWAASRGRPSWLGRAEVRAPQPGSTDYPEPEWTTAADRDSGDRWWLPIVVGVVALVLLAGLGYGFYLLVQNSNDDDKPGPATSPSVLPTQTVPTTGMTTETTPPSTEPTTTPPTTTPPTTSPSTTDPTTDEVTIPALKGLSLAEAQAALQRVGVGYRLLYRASDAQPGTVIDSDPAEGQEVPPDTTVTLVISAARTTTPTATLTTGPTDGNGGNND
jgi:hypothetical protein